TAAPIARHQRSSTQLTSLQSTTPEPWVPGQLSPSQVVGTHSTVEGASLTVTGSGNDLQVGDAVVVCGGVQTANAVVYMIDTVLMPPS
ncbi:fasciclin domain-containing protein, partial [Mycobacterium ulcerans]